MIQGICKGVNVKRALIGMVALFVYFFISDMIIHGKLLADLYRQSPGVWRMEADMHEYMCWMMTAKVIGAVFITLLFARGYEGKGWGEGLRFGILLGGLESVYPFVQYAVTPIPQALVWGWLVTGFIQSVLAGVVLGLVYKK